MKLLLIAFQFSFIFFITGAFGLENENAGDHKAKTVLIFVDPGLSGFPARSADMMSARLKDRGFDVRVSKSLFKPEDYADICALIIAGPVYAWNPSGKIADALKSVPQGSAFPVLVYLTFGVNLTGPRPAVEKIIKDRSLNLLMYSGFNQYSENSQSEAWKKSILDFIEPIK